MTAIFNDMIIPAKDAEVSATYYRSLLEIVDAPSWGPFVNLIMDDGVLLQYATPPTTFDSLHFAFLVDDAHFDRIVSWLVEFAADYWADPQRRRRNEIQNEDGGRALYVLDPAGHLVEFLTRPYV